MGIHTNLAQQGWFYLPGHSLQHPRIVSYQDACNLAKEMGYKCQYVTYKPLAEGQADRFALKIGPYLLLSTDNVKTRTHK